MVNWLARDYPVLAFKVGVACAILSLLGLILYALASSAAWGNKTAAGFAMVASPVLTLLSLFFGTISSVILLNEVRIAKNDAKWKALWGAILLLLGIVGAALYLYLARKERKS